MDQKAEGQLESAHVSLVIGSSDFTLQDQRLNVGL